jgi:sterol desaturase/sphingolipid hydroxylase (fatty acid hydroxylase superfamily)
LLDPISEAVDAFTAAALLAALQIPLIASLPELSRRTGNPKYLTARILSVVSSIVFLGVALAASIYLVLYSNAQFFQTLYIVLAIGVVIIAVGLIYASGFRIIDDSGQAQLEKPPK